MFYSKLRQAIINLDLATPRSLFYCAVFMRIFTRSGSKLLGYERLRQLHLIFLKVTVENSKCIVLSLYLILKCLK